MKTKAVPRIGSVAATLSLTALLLTLGATPGAQAEIISAEVFKDVYAGANATDINNPGVTDTFDTGPVTTPVLSGGGSTPFDVQRERGNAKARAHGIVQYLVSPSEVTSTAMLEDTTTIYADSNTAAASAQIDATLKLTFEVDQEAEYRVWGWVQSARNLDEAELAACTRNGVVLAGDTRADPLTKGVYLFDVTRTLFPGEELAIECGGVIGGGQTSYDSVSWHYILHLSNSGPACTDPNGDGQTTATDSLTALSAAVGLAACDNTICDVNNSGSTMASDALAILTLAVGLPFAWECPAPTA